MADEHYEKIPNALTLDAGLSLAARSAYCVLRVLAYQAGWRDDGDEVQLPSKREICERYLGCSASTLDEYLAALSEHGWVFTRRGGRGLIYTLNMHRKSGKSRTGGSPKSGDLSRGRDHLPELQTENAVRSLRIGDVPAAVFVHGRNLPYDSLAAACRIAERSPRHQMIPTALNGDKRKPDQPGIREQFWEEVVAKLEGEGRGEQADAITPEQFEEALAKAVEHRAGMYRDVLSHATLTPTALQKWWSDLPALAADKRNGGDLASRLLNQSDELRQGGR